jgi:hypothetical protein
VKKNITLLYGFSFFDQFMIVIAFSVPYLATQGILFLDALNEKISSAFRTTVISMANLGPPRRLWDRRLGLPCVLSGLGIVFSIVFVVLLLPLVVRKRSLIPAEEVKS